MVGTSKAMLLAALCAWIVAASPAAAWWIPDGALVSDTSSTQYSPSAASDGSGGVIVAWYDLRGANYDIYAQKLDASGVALWTPGGVPVCTASGYQYYPMVVSDGAGGAVVAWYDSRNGDYDVYAQRLDADGAAKWTTNGVAVCTAVGNQTGVQLVSDGAGGAIVAWQDLRGEASDIYVQRVAARGALLWDTDGMSLCTATGTQFNPRLTSDGAGGAIVCWQDDRSGNYDIYAQRVDNFGQTWFAANGQALCTAAGNQGDPRIAGDGLQGAIVTWWDVRTGSYDVYAQRITYWGSIAWTADGVPICTASGYQDANEVAPDGSGGAFVVWEDRRSGPETDLYAQRVNASGAVQWAADGIAVSTAAQYQHVKPMLADGNGRVIVPWITSNGINSDLYVQKLDGDGTRLWTSGGISVSDHDGVESQPTAVADGADGAILVWRDYRAGGMDLYAQAVDDQGRLGDLAPGIHSVRDVAGDQGGVVNLAWDAARSDLFGDGRVVRYSLWRALDAAKVRGAGPSADLAQVDLDATGPVVRVEVTADRTWYWELVDTVDAMSMSAYGRAVPTLADSTAASGALHYFQVVAHTESPSIFWASDPDSGCSADNLPPDTPKNLTGSWSIDATALHWLPNHEPDLALYRLHRGDSPDFVPDDANLAVAESDTGWVDPTPGIHYYKLCAEDAHGNLSPYALLTPQQTIAAPPAASALRLLPNRPNPFNPRTTIRFEIPRAGTVRVDVYDLVGRRVRRLYEGRLEAGARELVWDGRDDRGAALGSGAYVCRLEFDGAAAARRMTLVR